MLLSGLAIFAAGCLGMLWVHNATLMLALRFLQAIGVCAAAVTWQAMVADYYPLRLALMEAAEVLRSCCMAANAGRYISVARKPSTLRPASQTKNPFPGCDITFS